MRVTASGQTSSKALLSVSELGLATQRSSIPGPWQVMSADGCSAPLRCSPVPAATSPVRSALSPLRNMTWHVPDPRRGLGRVKNHFIPCSLAHLMSHQQRRGLVKGEIGLGWGAPSTVVIVCVRGRNRPLVLRHRRWGRPINAFAAEHPATRICAPAARWAEIRPAPEWACRHSFPSPRCSQLLPTCPGPSSFVCLSRALCLPKGGGVVKLLSYLEPRRSGNRLKAPPHSSRRGKEEV